jgi:26S proteasome non-ATPase regulatory subunit 10
MLQLLLSHHPDLEAKDVMGWTPLMIACEPACWSILQYIAEEFVGVSGHYELASELVQAGAKVDAVNEKGQTSL